MWKSPQLGPGLSLPHQCPHFLGFPCHPCVIPKHPPPAHTSLPVRPAWITDFLLHVGTCPSLMSQTGCSLTFQTMTLPSCLFLLSGSRLFFPSFRLIIKVSCCSRLSISFTTILLSPSCHHFYLSYYSDCLNFPPICPSIHSPYSVQCKLFEVPMPRQEPPVVFL